MKILTYRAHFINQIAPLYDASEAESFFYIILKHINKLLRIDLALHPDFEMTPNQHLQWDKILEELKTFKPIQYILGTTEFFGINFIVNENTLIPRSETEELIELILRSKPDQFSGVKILDIGTGSGCIAISLAKNLPDASVFAIDISAKALEIAKQNAEINQVNVVFIEQNILETDHFNENFDFIVSNPPYVRNLEKFEISENVLNYEPHIALFVDDADPLLFYQKIAFLAAKSLTDRGVLFFEINQYLGKETVELLKKLNFNNIELFQDVYGNDRMIRCTLK